MGDIFGKLFQMTTFGESHGGGVGVVIDGCPAGLELDVSEIQAALDRRKPGQSHLTTQRKESDEAEILSGVFEGKTTGTALAILVRNADHRSKDYNEMAGLFRPSHADYTYHAKYGHRDWRGGGRSSARETIGRVAAGAVARKLLQSGFGITTQAWVSQVHQVKTDIAAQAVTLAAIEDNPVRCPDAKVAKEMIEVIESARKEGSSVGGVIRAVVNGCPAGLGEPVFDKLTADLAKALMSIPATRGVEFGLGFEAIHLKGLEHNDPFVMKGDRVGTATNNSGGIQGGISNGEPIELKVAFKPTATIMQDQATVTVDGKETTFKGRGRHDPCVLPRAVPVVEAMIDLVLADHLLRAATRKNISGIASLF